jgi:hypothetical protein
MGFELDAFLGKHSELQRWKERLPFAVVCDLSGDLGLVPLTGSLFQGLRARLGIDADRLDASQGPRIFPPPSYKEGVRRWGLEASAGTAVAYLSLGEFGNQSHEEATLWSDRREVLSRVEVRAVLDYLRDEVGINIGNGPIDLERHRGEDAAEKWVAAASQSRLERKP